MADAAVRARGLTKSYGKGPAATHVLRGVDFDAAAGEFVAVLGPSGSGKSTLLNLLGLMDRPNSGELAIGGVSTIGLEDGPRSHLRARRVGFVFQFDSMLPEFTILENVMMPARIAAAAQPGGGPVEERPALELMDSLGIASLRDRFPSQTSGGERQRAAVARALINSPAVVLADEPTGNLDAENGAKVFADFRRLTRERGAAVVLVTHDEPAARSADRILRMNAGVLR